MRLYKFLKSVAISLGQGLLKNEYIESFLNKHEKTKAFIKKRYNQQNFWGLSATLLGLAFLYVLFLFLGIIEDFVTAAPIVAADERLNNLLLLFRSDYYINIFLWITNLGRAQIVTSLIIILSLIFWFFKKNPYIIGAWVSLIGSSSLSALGKVAFHRLRPPFPVYTETSFSFPSGHATVAVAVFGFIAYFLYKNTKKLIYRILIILGGLLIIAAIGFSRIYLGVHYLSDVLAGYLLGLLWLILGISFVEWQLDKQNQERSRVVTDKGSHKIKIAAGVLLFLELGFFIYTAANYHPATPALATTNPVIISSIFDLPANFNLPKYSETIVARQQEPLSFMIMGRDDQTFTAALHQAGWLLADPINDNSLREIIKAALFNSSYSHAPMTPSFWNGETHTFGFEKSTAENSVRQRNHARFWKTNLKSQDGETIYVGTASLDTGLKWGITHKIAPDIDTERERLFQDLQAAQKVQDFKKEVFVRPTLGKNFTGDEFFTDGNIYVILLK